MRNRFNQRDEFDRQLTQALRPVDAPPGFAARIMDLAADTPAKVVTLRPRFVLPRLQQWVGGAIAVALVAGVFTAEQVQQRHRRALAQQQFDAAMRITDHALDRTRSRLERSGIRLP